MDKITVIIPTLDRPLLIKNLLSRILKERYLIECIYIVNTSTNAFRYKSKKVKTLDAQNLLVGKNMAFQKAKSRYVLVLDDDLILSKNCIKNLLGFLKFNKLSAVSGLLVENKKYSKNLTPSYLKFTNYNLAYINHKNHSKENTSVDFLPGGFMLVETSAIKLVGGWDLNFIYPFYNEDTDLTFRMKQKGLKLGYTSRAKALHLKAKGGVRRKIDGEFFYAFGFNNSYYYIKNFNMFCYMRYLIFRLQDSIFVVKTLNAHYIVEYIKGALYGAKKAKNISSYSKLQAKNFS